MGIVVKHVLAVLVIGLSLAWCASALAQAPDSPKARAGACLDRAAEMMRQSKFDEQADAYLCAADETAKAPGAAERAARFRGLSHLARAWAVYARGVTGAMGRVNLEEALRQANLALPLLKRPGALLGSPGRHLFDGGASRAAVPKYAD